tara:strand:+ start:487 stop:1149 length:663 start_codon:yes stop_codon:yes gene_type:complete
VNKSLLYLITILTLFPITGCKKYKEESIEFDNKSYINNFQLIQENTSNNTIIRIKSPRAIINPTNNDIAIFESSIEVLNDKGQDIQIKSGNSVLNNFNNLISAYDNVYISFLDNNTNLYIKTKSLDWDLNSSNIILNSPLDIKFDNSSIISKNGSYNINSNLLNINNNTFNRIIISDNGKKLYQIKIISDNAKWYKKKKLIEFISNKQQVETTINFLSTK